MFFLTSAFSLLHWQGDDWQTWLFIYLCIIIFGFYSWGFCSFPSTFSTHSHSMAQIRPASVRNTKFHLNWSCVKRWTGQPTDVRNPRAAPLVLAWKSLARNYPNFFSLFFTTQWNKTLPQSQLGNLTPMSTAFVFSPVSLFVFFDALSHITIYRFRDGWLRRENQILTLRDATDNLYLHIAGPQKWIWPRLAKCGQHKFPLHSASWKLQVQTQCRWKASPWKGFASKPGQISLSAYQPRIYSASLGYSLWELGIIAKVMTVMMSLYLAYVPLLPLLQHQPPPSTFPLQFIHSSPAHACAFHLPTVNQMHVHSGSSRHETVCLRLQWWVHASNSYHCSTSIVKGPNEPKKCRWWRRSNEEGTDWLTDFLAKISPPQQFQVWFGRSVQSSNCLLSLVVDDSIRRELSQHFKLK